MLIVFIVSYLITHVILNLLHFNVIYNCKIVSLIHSIVASFSILVYFCFHKYTEFDTNTNINYLILENSLSYFLVDLLKCIYKKDVLFTFHHIFSILYLFTPYISNVAGKSILLGLFLGEVSNPFLHIGWFLKVQKNNFYIHVWKLNTLVLIISRIIITPYFMYNIIVLKTDYITEKYIIIVSGFLFFISAIFWSKKQIQSYI